VPEASARRCASPGAARHEIHDQLPLRLTGYGLDSPDDPGRPVDVEQVTDLERAGLREDPGFDGGGSRAEFVTVTVEPFVRLRAPRRLCAPILIAARAIIWFISRRHAGL